LKRNGHADAKQYSRLGQIKHSPHPRCISNTKEHPRRINCFTDDSVSLYDFAIEGSR
jgi:hypothetical protein